MPASLVYDLALSEAEAGAFDKAKALFANRFFPREEGGTNVRQVWIRVRALEAVQAPCSDALKIVDHVGEAVSNLDFTRDGLAPFIDAPQNQLSFGSVEARCGRKEAASKRLERMARETDPANRVFGAKLARCCRARTWRNWKLPVSDRDRQPVGRRPSRGSCIWNWAIAKRRRRCLKQRCYCPIAIWRITFARTALAEIKR